MPISINWTTQVISIPRADLQLVQTNPSEIRQLDLDSFRAELRGLEDDPEGAVYPITHNHVAPVSVGGVTLARVVEIINGYTITFEDGQYAVNIVGGNSNVADRVNLNQVSVRSGNSAGLTYSKEVEDQSFQDSRVYIDTANGLPGANFPQGTQANPVDNLADAQLIITRRNLARRIYFEGSISVGGGDDLSGYNIRGGYFAGSLLTLGAGATVDNLYVTSCFLRNSVLGSAGYYEDCLLLDVQNFGGFATKSKLGGIIQVSEDSDFFGCYGTVAIVPTVPNLTINVVNFTGQLTIAGLTDADTTINVTCLSATVVIDSSCTGGEILIGDGDLVIDGSAGSTVTEINKHDITHQLAGQIAAQTDQLTFTGSEVNANIERVNGQPIQGTGVTQDPWGP